MQQSKKQKIFLLTVTCLLFACVIAAFSFPPVSNKIKEIRKDVVSLDKSKDDVLKKDAEELKEQNKDVLKAAIARKSNEVRRIDESDHIWGDLSAPVQFVVYGDFRCPLCASYIDTLEKVREEYPEEVVIAFRHYYLRSQSDSLQAAMAVECAAEQDKFWEMYDELYKNRIDSSIIDDYSDAASVVGIDLGTFSSCMEEEKYADKIRDDMKEAVEFGVLGTPSSFINGQKIPGDYAFEDFRDSSGREREGVRSIIEKTLIDKK